MDHMGNEYALNNPQIISFKNLFSYITHIQEFHLLRHSTRQFEMGRFETLQFWDDSNHSNTAAATTAQSIPRFTFYILDANLQGQLSIAVFLIPFGRESDYQFTTKDGLLDIAFQANCKRLIAVSCNRPHTFPDSKGLQDELSPLVLSLKLNSMRDDEAIPYMAINTDNSWEVLAQGESQLSGMYVVEEKLDYGDKEDDEDRDEDDIKGVYRRLIFLQNQQFIQTEAYFLKETGGSSAEKHSSKKKKKKKSTSKKSESASGTASGEKTDSSAAPTPMLKYDYSYLDDHHKAILISLSFTPSLFSSTDSENSKSLLIGLGGGSLPMVIQKYIPALQLVSVEIDPTVYEIATKYFQFQPNANSTVVIREGIDYVNELSTSRSLEESMEKLNVSTTPSLVDDTRFQSIILDVDCKDPSLGISAPPKEFITRENISKFYNLLSGEGMLIINTVARNKKLFDGLVQQLKDLFVNEQKNGKVLQIQPSSENVNVCLICMKSDLFPTEISSSNSSKKKKINTTNVADLKGALQRNHLRSLIQNLLTVSSCLLPFILFPFLTCCLSFYLFIYLLNLECQGC
jgi:spermidine synthase